MKDNMNVVHLKRQVQSLGGSLANESSGRWTVYQCDAPSGKCWAATGDTHTLRVEWRKDEPAMRLEAIKDALTRVAMGLCDCDCEECSP